MPSGFAMKRREVGIKHARTDRCWEARQRWTLGSAPLQGSAGPPEASKALTLVLNESTERDEVTLWHLLSRVPPLDRDRVFDRLATFAPPPAGVTREGIRNGDKQMLGAWWDALGLGSTSLWRKWSQQWKE